MSDLPKLIRLPIRSNEVSKTINVSLNVSCECVGLSPQEFELNPAALQWVDLSIQPQLPQGSFEESFSVVLCADAAGQVTTWPIKGSVFTPCLNLPLDFSLGRAWTTSELNDLSKTFEVELFPDVNEVNLSFDREKLDVTAILSSSTSVMQLSVKPQLSLLASSGPKSESIQLTFTTTEGKVLGTRLLPVCIDVQPPISFAEGFIHFGVVEQCHDVVRQVTVVNTTGERWEALEGITVSSTSPDVSTSWSKNGLPFIEIRGNFISPGEKKSTVRLEYIRSGKREYSDLVVVALVL